MAIINKSYVLLPISGFTLDLSQYKTKALRFTVELSENAETQTNGVLYDWSIHQTGGMNAVAYNNAAMVTKQCPIKEYYFRFDGVRIADLEINVQGRTGDGVGITVMVEIEVQDERVIRR